MRPPWLAVQLYRLVLVPGDESELGDLIEEFETLRYPAQGPAAARRWFWGQVIRSLVPTLVTPATRTGVGPSLVGVSLLMVAGVVAAGRLTPLPINRLILSYPSLAAFALPLFIGFSAMAVAVGGYILGRWRPADVVLAVAAASLFVVVPEIAHLARGQAGTVWLPLAWCTAIPTALFLGATVSRRHVRPHRAT